MRLSELIPDIAKHNYKLLTDPLYRELGRLRKLPRYTAAKTNLIGSPMFIADAASTVAGYEEIFVNRHYQFKAATSYPLIIDCGSNVGLSVGFFKKIYPNCKIIAFEPDPDLFDLLRKNVEEWGCKDVELHQKAIWREEALINFQKEGGFSGRIDESTAHEKINSVDVQSVCLSKFLNQKVDFLKIDVEGAETDVLLECASLLTNVCYLFIEYHSQEGKAQTLDVILNILSNAGFRYHIKDAYTAAMPFIERPTLVGMELQLDIFAFRNE